MDSETEIDTGKRPGRPSKWPGTRVKGYSFKADEGLGTAIDEKIAQMPAVKINRSGFIALVIVDALKKPADILLNTFLTRNP